MLVWCELRSEQLSRRPKRGGFGYNFTRDGLHRGVRESRNPGRAALLKREEPECGPAGRMCGERSHE